MKIKEIRWSVYLLNSKAPYKGKAMDDRDGYSPAWVLERRTVPCAGRLLQCGLHGWMDDGIVVLAWESSHCSSTLYWLDSYGQQRNLSEALFSQVHDRNFVPCGVL